jgi:hypothetical protein
MKFYISQDFDMEKLLSNLDCLFEILEHEISPQSNNGFLLCKET